MNRFFFTGRFVSAALWLACSAPAAAQEPLLNPITWSITETGLKKPLPPQAVFTVPLTARIAAGWHLYSTSQPEDGPIPTRIWYSPLPAFQSVKELQFPVPHKVFDTNFEREVEYYEGSPVFFLSMKVAPQAVPGKHTLTLNARYQACNDRLCLPPRSDKILLELEVAGKK